LSVRTKLVHWAVASAAVALLGLLVVVAPSRRALGGLRQKAKALEARIAKTEQAVSGVQDFGAVLEQRRGELAAIQARTCRSGELAKVISLLTSAAAEEGVTILNIKSLPREELPEEGKKIYPSYFSLEVECRYRTLGAFLERLENSLLILMPDGFSATPQPSNPELLRIDMTLEGFEELA